MGLNAAGQRGALARAISQALSRHKAATWLKWPGGIEWSLNGSQAHDGINPTRWSLERAHTFLPMHEAGGFRSQSLLAALRSLARRELLCSPKCATSVVTSRSEPKDRSMVPKLFFRW